MSKIDIDAKRAAFQLALVAGTEHLRPNFDRVEVESGYSGYKEPLMEAAFAGWLLATREYSPHVQALKTEIEDEYILGYMDGVNRNPERDS